MMVASCVVFGELKLRRSDISPTAYLLGGRRVRLRHLLIHICFCSSPNNRDMDSA